LEAASFLKLFEGHPQIESLIEKSGAPPGEKIHLQGVIGSARSIIAAKLYLQTSRNLLVVLPEREEAAYFYDDLVSLGLEEQTLFFPASYKKSVQFGQSDQESLVLRTEALNKLSSNGQNYILVTYPEGLVEKVVSRENLAINTLTISKGEKISIEFINEFLFEYGFERVDFVTDPGQFSIRGSIVDIFSYANEDPYRLDFFGNEVDSIRSFDISDQVSRKSYERITLVPDVQRDLFAGKRTGLPGFMPQDTICMLCGGKLIADQLDQIVQHALNQEVAEVSVNREDLLDGRELKLGIQGFTCIESGSGELFKAGARIGFRTSKQPVFNKNFNLLAENLQEMTDTGYRILLLTNQEKQAARLKDIFREIRQKVVFEPVMFTLHEGFADHDLQLCCYTDHQIFERYHRFRLRTRKPQREAITLKELNMLHPGDYVVHTDHGIGKFAGLVKTEVNGKLQEAIRLVYRDNDSLLVSIHSLHRISKYKGKDGTEPSLNKLGTAAWQNLKNRTKSKVKDIARELIALYARRREEHGFAFSPDSYLQTELEASFIYEDTPDQVKTTQAIKDDMEKTVPMDRLVCGDVGFGKTEVAIRAAFKAVTDGKQVAVLVPTTILALQHYKTFSERLADFPVKVSYISRLRSTAEIRDSLKEVKEGKVDIIIGTHRLVSNDVKFKDLGLLIVDEEQKFGVGVKDKLKKLKVNVDTLTLTATPIPRTLQFSLMGARDLSIIQTPPPNRYPIITEVHGFNEKLIRDAILYEVGRNGQVFFIHNRVQNIHEVEATINRIVPGVRTIVGHGQMDGHTLEKVMLGFINGHYDVLIATTIIESGLDIPNANTMIINQAQNFGLSDLHQLRGRVGRSNKKAFCYLITPPPVTLTNEARRRLKAIEEFSDLGSGFNISMQDLDIRGAGNLLGAEQSGFIADIGFETYHRILNEAVQELKSEEFSDLFRDQQPDAAQAFLKIQYVNDCQIDTDMELLFPDSYIPGTAERMMLYRELDNQENESQLQKFEASLTDRFGKLPAASSDLLNVVRLRWAAMNLGVERIVLKNQKMICYFPSDQRSPYYQSDAFGKVLRYVQTHPRKCRMKEEGKLTLTFEAILLIGEAVGLLKDIDSLT
jgi:transcription-repair coupling factor (superfamily II helicase)